MPIVVTGFEPFGSHSSNPSGLLVQRLSGRPEVVTEVLPTSYERAGQRVEALLREHAPSAVLMLGLSARARCLVLERRALNWDDSTATDNDGQRRSGFPIAPQGPRSYASTLPLDRFAALASEAGVQIEFSDDAGGFVCNHVYYRAAHTIEQSALGTRSGFVHLPLVERASDFQKLLLCIELFVRVLDET